MLLYTQGSMSKRKPLTPAFQCAELTRGNLADLGFKSRILILTEVKQRKNCPSSVYSWLSICVRAIVCAVRWPRCCCQELPQQSSGHTYYNWHRLEIFCYPFVITKLLLLCEQMWIWIHLSRFIRHWMQTTDDTVVSTDTFTGVWENTEHTRYHISNVTLKQLLTAR